MWNNLDSDLIYAGQTLKVHGSEEAVSLGDNTRKYPGTLNTYVIHSGDALATIAEKFSVSVTDIKKWNNLNSNKIIAGKTLKIYSDKYDYAGNDSKSEKDPVSYSDPVNKSSKHSIKTHKVKSGESLYSIAEKYDISIDDLKKQNHLKGNKIIIGQILKIRL